MADLREGRARTPLFLDQTEARRTEKIFLGDRPPPLLSKGLDPSLASNHRFVFSLLFNFQSLKSDEGIVVNGKFWILAWFVVVIVVLYTRVDN